MKIIAKEVVSQEKRTETFDTQFDFGFSDEDWKKLSQSNKEKVIKAFVAESTEQPCWVLEEFYETI